MKYFSRGLVIVLLSVFIAAGCRVFFPESKKPEKITIATARQLGPEWLEIAPQPPLAVTAKIHFVGLKVPNIKGWADEGRQKLRLADGGEIKIEIELIDANGGSTMLFPNGFGADYVEFGKRAANKEKPEESYFQTGTEFKKVRLRSDKPVTAEEIVWTEFEL